MILALLHPLQDEPVASVKYLKKAFMQFGSNSDISLEFTSSSEILHVVEYVSLYFRFAVFAICATLAVFTV